MTESNPYDFRLIKAVSVPLKVVSGPDLCKCYLLLFAPTEELYVSDKQGSDVDADGSEQKPFKTPLKVPLRFISSYSVYHSLMFSVIFPGAVVCWKRTVSGDLCGLAEGRRGVNLRITLTI